MYFINYLTNLIFKSHSRGVNYNDILSGFDPAPSSQIKLDPTNSNILVCGSLSSVEEIQ